MWILTKYGFYSIACANDANGEIDPGTVMARARVRKHLENLLERFAESSDDLHSISGLPIIVGQYTDYKFRIILPMAVWVQALSTLAQSGSLRKIEGAGQGLRHGTA